MLLPRRRTEAMWDTSLSFFLLSPSLYCTVRTLDGCCYRIFGLLGNKFVRPSGGEATTCTDQYLPFAKITLPWRRFSTVKMKRKRTSSHSVTSTSTLDNILRMTKLVCRENSNDQQRPRCCDIKPVSPVLQGWLNVAMAVHIIHLPRTSSCT